MGSTRHADGLGAANAALYGALVLKASWASSAATRRSMQSNRSRDTGPELAVRRLLHAAGLRYRVCARPIPEVRRTTDLVFRPSKVAVEVRGCFWHGCDLHYKPPVTNNTYWAAKVARNMARDSDTAQRLIEAGWLLVVVWEHDDAHVAAERVAAAVRQRRPRARHRS
jgi:DNA mismatch endonuclease (patch repair protein)